MNMKYFAESFNTKHRLNNHYFPCAYVKIQPIQETLVLSGSIIGRKRPLQITLSVRIAICVFMSLCTLTWQLLNELALDFRPSEPIFYLSFKPVFFFRCNNDKFSSLKCQF